MPNQIYQITQGEIDLLYASEKDNKFVCEKFFFNKGAGYYMRVIYFPKERYTLAALRIKVGQETLTVATNTKDYLLGTHTVSYENVDFTLRIEPYVARDAINRIIKKGQVVVVGGRRGLRVGQVENVGGSVFIKLFPESLGTTLVSKTNNIFILDKYTLEEICQRKQ